MKPIKIQQKMKPYSCLSGIEIPLAQVSLVLKIYPTYLEVHQEKDCLIQVTLNLKESPLKFSAHLNLHKGRIEVELVFVKGSVHYTICCEANQLILQLKRSAFKEIALKIEASESKTTQKKLSLKKEVVLLDSLEEHVPTHLEILSLGSHKKQQIEKIMERADVKELLPLLFLMGQYGKRSPSNLKEGNLIHLKKMQEALDKKKHDLILKAFNPLIFSAFTGMLVPHLEDPFHWGHSIPKLTSKAPSDFSLLSELYHLMRSFFVLQEKKHLFLLPHLPPELFCGRLIQVNEGDLQIDLEWTKKTLRDVKIKALEEVTLKVNFQKPIQKCRIRVENKSAIFKNKTSFTFEKSKTYYFDRFEK